MKGLLSSSVLLLGVCLACVGLWWLWTGLDIVQVERGWSAVIAGATMLSAGLVIVAMAAVLSRLSDIVDALDTLAAPGEATIADTAAQPDGQKPPVPAPDAATAGDRTIVGRHVSGGATYVMFADGSVEAQTPDGVMQFPSLDALRAYADEREAEDARVPDRS